MNRLSTAKRIQILQLLVEGTTLRSAARIAGVKVDTVIRLQKEAGRACLAFHNRTVKGVYCEQVQCDEIWSFCHTKQRNLKPESPGTHGNIWTWTALDVNSRLIINWYIGRRDVQAARRFMKGLKKRLVNIPILATDGYLAYNNAVQYEYGESASHIQIVGQAKYVRQGSYLEAEEANTSLVERHNRTIRSGISRFARRTDAHSKKTENHRMAQALFFTYYNFVRPHTTLSKERHTTPAMEIGLIDEPYTLEWIIEMMNEQALKAA